MSAIKKWSIDKVSRAAEEKGPASSHVILLKLMSNFSMMMTVKMRKIFLTMGTQNVFF